MTTFSKSGEFYLTQLVTGPSSIYLRLRFSETKTSEPIVKLVQPDQYFGNATTKSVIVAAQETITKVNSQFGSNLIIAEIKYQSDNDARCVLLRSAIYLIAERLVKHGEIGFDEIYQRREEAKSRWETVTTRTCPDCESLCPEYRKHCLVCGYELGREISKDSGS